MLKDIIVLEVADALTGPLAGLMLSDFGAKVIKVEAPEWKRSLEVRIARRDEPVFLSANRGKKSIVLDLTLPEGREVFEALVRKSDVIISNYPPSVVKKLGLDFETLGRINPRIICCNISGYGVHGKNVERPAYDLAIQAASGLMSVTGEEGGPPLRAGVAITDEMGGIMATLGVLAAYIGREKEGKGRQIDISMFDNALFCFGFNVLRYYLTGEVPGPVGFYSSAGKRADYRAYETKDGYIVVAAGRDENKWHAFCRTLGTEEFASDPKFDAYDKRTKDENRVKLERIFEPIFRTKTIKDWIALFSAVDIPCSPVNTLDKVLQEAEDSGREMIIEYPLPLGGMVKGIGNPVKVGTKENLNAPPRFGEHTKEVLTDFLDYSDARILKLADDKIIFIERIA